MSVYSLLDSKIFGTDNWCFQLHPLYKHGLLTSLSNGEVHLIDWKSNQSIKSFKIGNTAVNGLKLINSDSHGGDLFASCAMDTVKIFDVRQASEKVIGTIKSENESPFLSLDSRHGKLACGTELKGVDAQLHLYDIRKLDSTWKSFVDSHHDDITCIKFHPTDPTVLLSGSTDGYTNIYDLTEEEEDDSLHQVINYESIHSCGWLSPRRIFTLSHMETFAIHELNDKSEELKEPQPLDFGDIREKWGCDYVIDLYPGFVATGKSHEEGDCDLKLIPFMNEIADVNNSVTIKNPHGSEVVRDVFIPSTDSSLLYSCGEDGSVKVWKNSNSYLTTPETFWDYSIKSNVLNESVEVNMVAENETAISMVEPVVDEEASKEMKKSKKEKKDKEKKHKSKDKKHKKSSKGHRYKPY